MYFLLSFFNDYMYYTTESLAPVKLKVFTVMIAVIIFCFLANTRSVSDANSQLTGFEICEGTSYYNTAECPDLNRLFINEVYYFSAAAGLISGKNISYHTLQNYFNSAQCFSTDPGKTQFSIKSVLNIHKNLSQVLLI